MHTLMDVHIFAYFFFYLIITVRSDLYDLSSEYNSECTLLPRKLFAFIGSNKRVKGRTLSKTYTSTEAVGKCMNLCAVHKHCNAINFKRVQDSENCVLFQAARIVETEAEVGWLAYKTTTTCIPGCYENAGMCLRQVNSTGVSMSSGDGHSGNNDEVGNGIIQMKAAYRSALRANQLIWIRMDFGKSLRVVRVVLYVLNEAPRYMVRFAVKVGGTDVGKAKYCADNIDLYPGEVVEDFGATTADKKDIYCAGPLEGQYVYFSKYTIWAEKPGKDNIRIAEAIIFAEKM